ncbi:hypothetical protein OY671_010316, partial [Metschnikowia pulcherrima]
AALARRLKAAGNTTFDQEAATCCYANSDKSWVTDTAGRVSRAQDGLSSMSSPEAVDASSALAHGHRLGVFRSLVRAGADGSPAGEIAREVGVLPNTSSTHLTILGHAGLIQSRREGRSVIYSADYDGMRGSLGFLVSD